MRTIDLLGKILIEGYQAEIRNKPHGLFLIVKPEHRLSGFVGNMIRNEGFKFRYCYNEDSGKTVVIFYKDQDEDGG